MKIVKPILLYLLLVFSAACWSQNRAVDSLLLVLQKTENDIDKAQLLNAIADEYKTSNPKLMADYATKALQLATKIKFNLEKGNAYLNLGNANIIQGNYPGAMQYFTSAQSIFEAEVNENSKNSIAVKKGLAKAYGSIGIVFSEQSNYAKALQFYFKSVKIYEALKDAPKCAKLYNNIGIAYQSQSADFKALDYFIKAQKIQEKLGDVNIGITLTNIGNCYLKQKNFPETLAYYSKAEASLKKHPNPRALGELLNNFGLYFKAINNSAKAVESWNQAFKTFAGIDDKFGVADTYLYLGQLYLEQNKLADAIFNANKSLALSTETGALEQTMLSEKLLSDIYTKQNNSNLALQHYQKFSQAKDSLVNEESIRKGVEAEMNFDFEKREVLQQSALEKKDLLYKEQSKRNMMQLIFACLFGLLLFGIAFLIYNRYQLKKTLTLQKELAEYEQKALHLQMNPHFVFNCLGSISSFIVQNGTDSAIKYLSKFSKLMRLTLEYSKESLIPIDKEIESLQNYLELEQLRFNNKFSFTIYKGEDIDDDLALPPLLLQPFVENAIIHGVIPSKEMGSIAIAFKIEKESLICTVTDNGIGFNKSKALKENTVVVHKSMALDITKKRLQMIESATAQKADVTIEEMHNNDIIIGTKVTLNLPLQYISN